MLAMPERLELPLERIRAALKTHCVDNGGTIYWVASAALRLSSKGYSMPKMTASTRRLSIDPLILRDRLDAADPVSSARTELYFSSFFVAYAADLKIGARPHGLP
jgi:hypothetical protein